jgi:hypothetical protein
MKNRILRLAALAAAAALPLLGAGAASAHVRPAVTPPCGSYCNELFVQQLGPAYTQSTAAVYGAPVTLQHASNSAVKEDMHATNVGTLDQFVDAGVISASSYVALNYPDSTPVWENEASPGGFNSGLCIAVRGHAVNGSPVILRNCGRAARSLWVADTNNFVPDVNSIFGADWPWINASDRSASHPLVLTQNGVGGQLSVTVERSALGIVLDGQQWGLAA